VRNLRNPEATPRLPPSTATEASPPALQFDETRENPPRLLRKRFEPKGTADPPAHGLLLTIAKGNPAVGREGMGPQYATQSEKKKKEKKRGKR